MTDLAQTPAPRSAVGETSEPTQADDGPVRKTVTVVFVDLVGSTAFQESVDPEAARGAMTRYYDMVQRVVDQHHGTVAKFQGDGALAVFGMPEVAEDDAVRAVATGVALQHAFADVRDYVADRHGVDVGLRVGINTGEVVIAAEDADLVGDVLNTAARLEAACTPGRVMVGEDTWRLTRSTITYEVLGEISVKGKAEPIATFQVVEDVRANVTGDDAATPFVGRAVELAALRGAYRVAGETTSARLVTVIGSPGVGKTRLAAELASSTSEAHSFDLRCERAGTSTFAPVADLIRTVAGIGADHSGPQVEAAVGEWLDGAPDAERLGPLLSSFVGGGGTFSTEELFFGARRLVELAAADAPAILVVDDIQWAEPLLLDLLEHLVEWVTDAHVLVVGLARPELREIRPSLAEPGRRVEGVISVEGLDPAATAELAAKLVGADRLPPDLLARLPDSTQGNPLFVRELMQMLVDDGVIASGPAGWALTIDADAVDVPPTIQSLLSTRVERMPLDERRLVELAAVVGPDFARGAVAAIADGWSPDQVDDVLRRLQRKEVIEPTGSYWGNEPIYRFHHVLIRDAAYRRLLKGTRAELHLLVAEWTEQTASALTGEHEVAIAHHYEQAYAYRRELGLDDEATAAAGANAAGLLTVAADRALASDDLPAAGSLALRAIDCLASDSPEAPALLLTANEALLSAGDVARASPTLERLETFAHEERLRLWAICFRGQLTVLADPTGLDVAAARLDDAAVGLERLDDHAGVAKARQIRALALAALGRVGDCEAELDRALTAARNADDRRRVTAVLGAAPIAALWGPSPVPRAGGRCLDVIRLLRITTGSPAVEATSIRCQAVLEALRGRFDTARTMLATARRTAEEIGLRRDLMETEFYAGLVELLAADAVAAEPHLRAAYDGLGRLGIGADTGQAAAHLARALLLQGRIDEAEELAETSGSLAGQNTQTAIAARSVRAEVLSARGRHDEAAPLAEEAVAIAAGTDILVDHAQALAALARVQAAAGRPADAARAAADASSLFDRKGATVDVGTGSPGASAQPPERLSADPASPASLPSNRCTEVFEALGDAYNDGDWPRYESLVSDPFVYDPRHSGVRFGEMSARRDLVRNVEARHDLGYRLGGTPLAVRGQSLALFDTEYATESGDAEPLLVVAALNHSDLIGRIAVYDPDDHLGAYRELERLFLDSLDPADREPWASLVDWLVAHNGGDVEAMEAWMQRDLQVIDHGTLGWGTQDRDSAVARFAGTAGELDYAFPTEILRYEDGSSLSRHRYQFRDGAAVEGYALTYNTTETTHRAEYFDIDQLDLAIQRFEEVTATGSEDRPAHAESEGHPPLDTVSTRLLALQAQSFADRDWETFAGTFSEPFDYDSARSGPRFGDMSTRAQLVANMRARAGLGYDRLDMRPMATRGEHLDLSFVTFSNPSGALDERVQVHEVGRHGLMERVRGFDPDDLQRALAHIDERYVESLPTEHARVFEVCRRQFEALNARDWTRFRDTLAPDMQMVDHRPLGFEAAGADGYVAWLSSINESTQRSLTYLVRVVAVNADGIVLEACTRSAAPDNVSNNLWVSIVANGHLVRTECFAADAFDDAMRRFDDLTAPESEAAVADGERERRLPGTSVSGRKTSMMQAAWDRVRTSFNARDWEAFAAVHAPDYRYRSFRSGPCLGRFDSYADYLPQMVERANLGLTLEPQELIASRGDRVALCRVRLHDPSGNVEERLNIDVLDTQGRLAELYSFDPDDVPSALEQLDRIAEDGAQHRSNRDRLAEQVIVSPEIDLGVFVTDLVVDDRRTMAQTEMSGRASLSAYNRDRLATRFDLIVERDDRLMLHAQTATDPAAGWASDFLAINRFNQEGQCDLLVLFDPSDRDAALAEFDRLVASTTDGGVGPGGDPTPWNRAAAAAVAQYEASVALDGRALRDTLGDDVVFESHRALSGGTRRGREPVGELLEGMWAVGLVQTQPPQIIRVHADDLCLASSSFQSADGYGIDVTAVFETEESGRLSRFSTFDGDDERAAETFRAWADSSAPRHDRFGGARSAIEPETRLVRSLHRLVEAGSVSDRAGVEALLAADVEQVVHRGIGAPAEGRDEWISTFIDLMNIGEGSFDVLATRGDRLALVDGRRSTPEGFEIRFLFLARSDAEGRVDHMENFDTEDLAAALARLDDLFVASLASEDRQPYARVARGIHARNAVATGRSAMVPPGASFTGDGAIEFPELAEDSDAARLLGAAELGGITVMQPVHVARQGAVLASLRTTLDEAEVVWHFVFRSAGGTLVVTYFDDDALDDAWAALDAPTEPRAVASDRPRNRATEVSDRISEQVRNGHVDDLIDWWHHDAVARDYSRLGQGTGGPDEFVAAMRSWREVWDIGQPDAGGPIAVNGDQAALVEYRFGTVGSWSVDRLAVLAVDEDDKITELTFYDHEDREAALAALAALDVPEGPGSEPSRPLTDAVAHHGAAWAGGRVPSRGSAGRSNRADRFARSRGVRFPDGSWTVVETLGVRLDDFALHRIVSDDGATGLALSCWTAAGDQVTAQRFDDNLTQKAFFELDEWAGDTLPADLWRDSPVRRWAKATQEQDWETARRLLDPDYEARVHQLLGPESMSGDSLIRWFESLEARSSRIVVATPEVHAVSPIGTVQSEEFEEIDSAGYSVSNGGISANTFRDGRLFQSVRFDDEELDEALMLLEDAAAAAGVEDSIIYMSEPARGLRRP